MFSGARKGTAMEAERLIDDETDERYTRVLRILGGENPLPSHAEFLTTADDFRAMCDERDQNSIQSAVQVLVKKGTERRVMEILQRAIQRIIWAGADAELRKIESLLRPHSTDDAQPVDPELIRITFDAIAALIRNRNSRVGGWILTVHGIPEIDGLDAPQLLTAFDGFEDTNAERIFTASLMCLARWLGAPRPGSVRLSESEEAFLQELDGNGEMRPADLARKLGLSEKTVKNRKVNLARLGFVDEKNDRYFVTEAGRIEAKRINSL